MPALDLTPDLIFTLAVLGVAGGAFWLASHRAAQPADPLRPRLVPWRGVIIASGFAAFVALVHLVNLAGFTTGR
ncbi:MAG: hypothetical protein EBZ50_03110 [Alphaproteobacteria bacterium]|nr:hypothetical protein [Alphaproteobacteria bacterium]